MWQKTIKIHPRVIFCGAALCALRLCSLCAHSKALNAIWLWLWLGAALLPLPLLSKCVYNIICVVAIVIIGVRCRIVFTSHVDDTPPSVSSGCRSADYCVVVVVRNRRRCRWKSNGGSSSAEVRERSTHLFNMQGDGCLVTTDTRLFRRCVLFYCCYCYGVFRNMLFLFGFSILFSSLRREPWVLSLGCLRWQIFI